ncbi:MAG TPA: hypothetical protein VNQ33_09545 [Acidimicrobiales bacterium]|nr:hypothetical protein [Acidimicrobiales bacterium]
MGGEPCVVLLDFGQPTIDPGSQRLSDVAIDAADDAVGADLENQLFPWP